jgi:predicted alpha/beta-fold hydrolase
LLDCGDGVRLQALHARPAHPAGRVAILLHGWEGSADSHYMLALGHALFASGTDVVRLNLRDHGNTHHLNEAVFHSCRLPEVVGAVAALGRYLPGVAPWLIGFSLGGNFMLRVAASQSADLPALAGAIAISPVLHPDRAMAAMEQGPQIYQRYFVSKWQRSLRRKRAAWPAVQIDDGILDCRDLRAMTAAMVARHTDFASMQAYLEGYAITGARLETLTTRATILAAQDDPIIPSSDLALLAQHPLLRVVAPAYGGHMGFMISPFRPSWVIDFVRAELGLPR